jgi:hypothetical protein
MEGLAAIHRGDDWRPDYSTETLDMGSMKDLLGDTPAPIYPNRPGWSEPTTSKAAAEAVADTAGSLRALVLESLRLRPATVHETAERIGRAVPSIQPRFSELRALDQIEPAGEIKKNKVSGKPAQVWRVK